MSKDAYAHIEDKELLEKFYTDGNNYWLGMVLQRYTMLLLGVCMKYLKNEDEAKDSVQQIFLKVIVELHKYRVDYFKSWLYMVAKNHLLMKIRDRHGKITLELSDIIMKKEEDQHEHKTDMIQRDHTLNVVVD